MQKRRNLQAHFQKVADVNRKRREEYNQAAKAGKLGRRGKRRKRKKRKRKKGFQPEPTPSEQKFARLLKEHGIRFEQQKYFKCMHPDDPFKNSWAHVDFYLPDYRVVVEIYGSIHASEDRRSYDRVREIRIKARNRRIARFFVVWNRYVDDPEHPSVNAIFELCGIYKDDWPVEGDRRSSSDRLLDMGILDV